MLLVILLIISITFLLINWRYMDKQSRKHMLTAVLVFFIVVYYHQINQDYDIKFQQSGIVIRPKCNKYKQPSNKIPRGVTPKVKKIVASAQQWKCAHCHNLLDATYEVDHMQPLCKGGNNDRSNLQALCRNCHGKKTLNDLF